MSVHTPLQHRIVAALSAALLFVGFLAPFHAHAAITNGQDAIDALGTYNTVFTDPQAVFTKSAFNNGPHQLGFFTPTATALDEAHHRLFVADYANNRVLVYTLNNDNTLQDRIPDRVLGQPDFISNAPGLSQSRITSPGGLAYDPIQNRLFVSELTNNRVTVFDVTDITNGENAIHVLGQANFGTATALTSTNSTRSPRELAFDSVNQRLFVAQLNSNRVTVFNTTTIDNNESAVALLGQTSYFATGSATTQAGMFAPFGLAYDSSGQRLFVSQLNNRVTVYDVAAITNGEPASHVLGQTSFTTSGSATTDTGMHTPTGLAYDESNSLLFVSQAGNHRVTIYDVADIVDGEAAIHVLGQSSFITGSSATDQARLDLPAGLTFAAQNSHLYVSDRSNNRVMIFDVLTIVNGENAVEQLGQNNEVTSTTPLATYGKRGVHDGPNRLGFNGAQGGVVDRLHHRYFQADGLNNRVLVYNLHADGSFLDRIPDYVLGQPDFATNNGGTLTQSELNTPTQLAYHPQRNLLFVADTNNSRIMIFDVAEITNGENAAHVLGRPNFGSSGAIAQARTTTPIGVALDKAGNRLFVSSQSDRRITVFDIAEISNGENATHVLGQPDFTTTTPGTTALKLSMPKHIAYDEDRSKLFVADREDNRVLVFDVAEVANGEAATHVLGQDSFTTDTSGTTQSSFSNPEGLTYDPYYDRLYVSEAGNNRVTVFDTVDINDGEAAVAVLGQSTFEASTANLGPSSLIMAGALTLDEVGQRLFVANSGHRVSIFDLAPQAGFTVTESGTTDVEEGGSPDSFDVVLTDEPPSDVVINVTSEDTEAAVVSPTTITFTRANWQTPQTVTVTAPEDANVLSEVVEVTLSIDDNASTNLWEAVADQQIQVNVMDNDEAGFTITESLGTTLVEEGGATDSFDVVLTAQPQTDVVFEVTSMDESLVTTDPATLTFSPLTWDTPQTVTITAQEDENTLSETTEISVSVSALDSDDAWDALPAALVTVHITDNDNATLPVPSPFTGGGGGFGPPAEAADPQLPEEPEDQDLAPSAPEDPHATPDYLALLAEHCSLPTSQESEPSQILSRADFILLLDACITMQPLPQATQVTQVFHDVPLDDTLAPLVFRMHESGMLQGYPDGTLRLQDAVSREEAIKLLLLARFTKEQVMDGSAPFEDVVPGQWYTPYVFFAYSRGIVAGYADEKGNPLHIFGIGDPIIRADAAKVVLRLMEF